MSLESYIAAMPKIELHVHLEGAIRPETLEAAFVVEFAQLRAKHL